MIIHNMQCTDATDAFAMGYCKRHATFFDSTAEFSTKKMKLVIVRMLSSPSFRIQKVRNLEPKEIPDFSRERVSLFGPQVSQALICSGLEFRPPSLPIVKFNFPPIDSQLANTKIWKCEWFWHTLNGDTRRPQSLISIVAAMKLKRIETFTVAVIVVCNKQVSSLISIFILCTTFPSIMHRHWYAGMAGRIKNIVCVSVCCMSVWVEFVPTPAL